MLELAGKGSIFASRLSAGHSSLVRIGDYLSLRHRFDQMVCLCAGLTIEAWKDSSMKAYHSTSAPRGSWFVRPGAMAATHAELYEAAANAPTELSTTVGVLASSNNWPIGLADLSGGKNTIKSLSAIGDLFYSFQMKSFVQVGLSADTSAVRMAERAIESSKKLGFTPFEEDKLREFMALLQQANALHFFHEVTQ
ncbi:hypothetical protein P5X00_36970 [Paraburkholderia sp. A2RO-4L]|uniref:hypothetical protein n=1 Tax=Paraburkholderia sp. A2RO-4L TaxID=3028374 RepID=UPI003DA9E587